MLEAIKAAGYEGVQGGDGVAAHALGLGWATDGRVNTPGEAGPIAKRAKDGRAVAATLHVAWGLEDDATVDALVDDVMEASAKHGVPMYIETHRATITQDIWRSAEIVRRRPGVRFNGDFSHWYTGLEMVYGGLENKLAVAQLVLDRVRFMHGRIGNPGSMQVGIGDTLDEAMKRTYVQHFAEMWTRAMAGFLKGARPGDVLVFAPELLQPSIYYGRAFPDASPDAREECDRWTQALLYCELAKRCFEQAKVRVAG